MHQVIQQRTCFGFKDVLLVALLPAKTSASSLFRDSQCTNASQHVLACI